MSTRLPYAALALSMALVGANVTASKTLVEHFPVFLLAAMRFVIASAILVPLLLALGPWPVRLSRADTLLLFLQAFFGVFLFSVFLLFGVRLTSATSAGVLTSTTPAFIGLLSIAFLRERPTRAWFGATVMIVLGIVAINLARTSGGGGKAHLAGNLLVLAAVVSEALFTILASRLTGRMTPLQMATGVNLFGVVLFAPPALWDLTRANLTPVPVQAWLLLLYFAVTASVLSFGLWYWGVAQVPAHTAGLFTGVMPITAAVTAGLALHERITWQEVLGMILVGVAIVFGTRAPKARRPSTAEDLSPL